MFEEKGKNSWSKERVTPRKRNKLKRDTSNCRKEQEQKIWKERMYLSESWWGSLKKISMWEVFQKKRLFRWMKLHFSRRERKLLLEALNMMQLHVSVEKGMFRVIQRQKAYEHQGGKQACLDHDAEIQPYIRRAAAISQITFTSDTFPSVSERS